MTLTQVAKITRRSILGFVILVTLCITSYIGYQIWYAHYLASLPPKEEKPDVKFGILPSPNFIASTVSSSNFSYQLATETGGLPDFGKLTKVYFIPKATTTFLAEDKVKALAKKLNFDTSPDNLENEFQFKKDGRILTIELDSGNFNYFSATPSAEPLSDATVSISNFRNLLQNLGILKDDLRDSPAKVEGNQILIWPKDIDKKPIVTAKFKASLIRAEASQSASLAEQYYSITFTFWPVDETTFSTYPIRSSVESLNDLKSGKGIIVVEPKNPQVSITKVYLAYLEGENYSPYLQPIFVFEGPNFVAYVPAITNQYLTPTAK